MVAWGPIIGAGINLLGGLFGKKKQETKTTVNYSEMVASAEAAGYNPLTVLRNGGSAGFTTTTSPTVSQMPEALGNFGGLLGEALQEKLDPIQAKKREIDTLMTDVQLKEARALAARPASFYRPVEWSGTKVSNQFVPRLGEKSHKQAASSDFIGPRTPSQFAKENKAIDMYVPYYDRFNDKIHYGVNPDVPDLDQIAVPTGIITTSEARSLAERVENKWTRPRNVNAGSGFRRGVQNSQPRRLSGGGGY